MYCNYNTETDTGDVTYIEFYGNGLPDHCYYADSQPAPIGAYDTYNYYEIYINFNLPWKETDLYANEVILGGNSASDFV